MRRWLMILLALLSGGAGCAPPPEEPVAAASARRIVSLDFCADQYVLKLVDHAEIAGLSPDATKSFSYMRAAAAGFRTVRPRAEDILLLKPDLVVRTYGGGANIAAFLERAGIDGVQIGYATNLAGVEDVIAAAARDLGVEARGAALIAEMRARLAAIESAGAARSVLYLTSKGAAAGGGTMIDDVIARAGFNNFAHRSGWGSIPLERLAAARPDLIAAGFFETGDMVTDRWTPARHPVVQRRLENGPVVRLPGAWTACGAWPLINAVEALAAAARDSIP